MSFKSGETEYKLEKELSYSHKGQFEKGDFLLFREPKIQHAQPSLKLKQIIQKSELETAGQMKKIGLLDFNDDSPGLKAGEVAKPIKSMAEEWEEDAQKIVDQIEMQLTQSSVDLYDFATIFWKMACISPSICLINGQIPMKSGFRDNISLNDFLGAPIWYCSFFVALSDSKKNSTSEEQ